MGGDIVESVVFGVEYGLLFVSIKPDNVRDHRVRTIILQAEKRTHKPDFVCIALLCGDLRLF